MQAQAIDLAPASTTIATTGSNGPRGADSPGDFLLTLTNALSRGTPSNSGGSTPTGAVSTGTDGTIVPQGPPPDGGRGADKQNVDQSVADALAALVMQMIHQFGGASATSSSPNQPASSTKPALQSVVGNATTSASTATVGSPQRLSLSQTDAEKLVDAIASALEQAIGSAANQTNRASPTAVVGESNGESGNAVGSVGSTSVPDLTLLGLDGRSSSDVPSLTSPSSNQTSAVTSAFAIDPSALSRLIDALRSATANVTTNPPTNAPDPGSDAPASVEQKLRALVFGAGLNLTRMSFAGSTGSSDVTQFAKHVARLAVQDLTAVMLPPDSASSSRLGVDPVNPVGTTGLTPPGIADSPDAGSSDQAVVVTSADPKTSAIGATVENRVDVKADSPVAAATSAVTTAPIATVEGLVAGSTSQAASVDPKATSARATFDTRLGVDVAGQVASTSPSIPGVGAAGEQHGPSGDRRGAHPDEQIATTAGSSAPSSARTLDIQPTATTSDASASQSTASRLIDQIANKLHLMTTEGTGEVRMQLRPDTLGRLDVRINLDSSGVSVHLGAESTDVQGLIQSNLDQLRTALQDQGIRADRFVVFVNPGFASAGQNDSGPRSRDPSPGRRARRVGGLQLNSLTGTVGSSPHLSPASGVDYLA